MFKIICSYYQDSTSLKILSKKKIDSNINITKSTNQLFVK